MKETIIKYLAFEKFALLFNLLRDRFRIIWNSPSAHRWSEVKLTFFLIRDLVFIRFLRDKYFIIAILLFLLFAVQIFFLLDFISYRSIDEAIQSQQIARAQKMIDQKLALFPNNLDLKLRQAHSYLHLGESTKAISIIGEIQAKAPNTSYLKNVLPELVTVPHSGEDKFRVLNILEKHLDICPPCQKAYVTYATEIGRDYLAQHKINDARNYLEKAYEISLSMQSSNVLLSRKRELANVYNLLAETFLNKSKKDKAKKHEYIKKSLELYVLSSQMSPDGITHLKVARLYKQKEKTTINDLRKSLEAYLKAYSLRMSEARDEYRRTRANLQSQLNKKLESEQVKIIMKEYPSL